VAHRTGNDGGWVGDVTMRTLLIIVLVLVLIGTVGGFTMRGRR
jgi:hypothetical protein